MGGKDPESIQNKEEKKTFHTFSGCVDESCGGSDTAWMLVVFLFTSVFENEDSRGHEMTSGIRITCLAFMKLVPKF